MSLIRKHVAVLQAWACLALVYIYDTRTALERFDTSIRCD